MSKVVPFKSKKRNAKLGKNQVTLDEIMIQTGLVMIRAVADTQRNGVKIKFQTEIKDEVYNIDVVIKKVVTIKQRFLNIVG